MAKLTLKQLRQELEKIQATLDFAHGRAPRQSGTTYQETYAQLYAEAEARNNADDLAEYF